MKLAKWKDASVFTRLILLYSLVIFCTVSLITGISVWNSYNRTRGEIDEKSEHILRQFQENIDTYAIQAADTFITSFIARDPSVAKLMNAPLDNNLALVADVHAKLRSYMFTSSEYNSIYVYAPGNAIVVSDKGSYFIKNGKYANQSVDWLIGHSTQAGSRATLMPDYLSHPLLEERNRSHVISCQRGYALSGQNAGGGGVIAVNLDVFTLYQQYSPTERSSFGDLFILDAQGRIIAREGRSHDLLCEALVEAVAQGKASGFPIQLGGKAYVAFYTASRMGDWHYVYVFASDVYYEQTSAIIRMGLLIALLTIIAPILATLQISKRVYNPIRETIVQSARLSKEFIGQSYGSHERHIGLTLNALSAMVGSLQKQIVTYEPEMKIGLLSRLLLQKNVSREEITERLSQLKLSLPFPYFACVYVLLDKGNLGPSRGVNGRVDSMAFNVCQFIENIDADNCIRLATDMLTDGIVVLINTDGVETIPSLCGAVLEYCQLRLKIQAVIGVGRPQEDLAQANHSYAEAVAAIRYRFVYTRQPLFFAEETLALDESPLKPEAALLERLDKAVNGKQLQEALDAAAQLMDNLCQARYAYDTIQNALLNILRIISRSKAQFMLHSEEIFDSRLNHLFFAAEDIHDFAEMICYLIERFFSLRTVAEANKPAVEIEKVKRYVLEKIENHQSKEVTLSAVAVALRRNPNYLSTLFSDSAGMKFKDFVMDAKLEYAKKQLHNPDAKVYQIAGDLGYYNVSYFIRIFKMKYGMTPKQCYESLQEQRRKKETQEG